MHIGMARKYMIPIDADAIYRYLAGSIDPKLFNFAEVEFASDDYIV